MYITKENKRRFYKLQAIMMIAVILCSQTRYVSSKEAFQQFAKNRSTYKDMNLGVKGIHDPTSTAGDPVCWEGSRVYFGNQGFLWRVLDKDGLLFSEEILLSDTYHFQTVDTNWEACSIRSYLNGYVNMEQNKDYSNANFIQQYFTPEEARSIRTSLVINNDNLEGTDKDRPGGPDTYDKLFLLSLEDVRNVDYGFSHFKNRVNALGNNTSSGWWLRSKGYNGNDHAAYIRVDGYVFSSGQAVASTSKAARGIRPAFNLDMSKVAFTLASGISKKDYGKFGRQNGSVESDHVDMDTWKLTLKATEQSLNVTTDSDLVIPSGTGYIRINHSKAAILDGATQVSAMLLDQNGEILHYGLVNNDVNATSSTVYIPEGLQHGDYILRVFAESVNNDKQTDYVSEYDDLLITVGEVRVNDIIGIPSEMIAGERVFLSAKVWPEFATHQKIDFKITDAGTTGAVLNGEELTVVSPGIVKLSAKVVNGMLGGNDYSKEFSIKVTEPVGTESPKPEPSKQPAPPTKEPVGTESPKPEASEQPAPPTKEPAVTEAPKPEPSEQPAPPTKEPAVTEPPKLESSEQPTKEPAVTESPKPEASEQSMSSTKEPAVTESPKPEPSEQSMPSTKEPAVTESPKLESSEQPTQPTKEPTATESPKLEPSEQPMPPTKEPAGGKPQNIIQISEVIDGNMQSMTEPFESRVEELEGKEELTTKSPEDIKRAEEKKEADEKNNKKNVKWFIILLVMEAALITRGVKWNKKRKSKISSGK